MRGYPAGMMMVTQAAGARRCGRGLNNTTENLGETDFQLFDGQQRLRTLLLGLGKGSLADSLHLWVDIGKPEGSGDRLYELRINSTGQPFGYRAAEPNTKLSADDRRKAQECWPRQDGKPQPPDKIFEEMARRRIGRLGSAKCAVSLKYVLALLIERRTEVVASKLKKLAKENADHIDDLLTYLKKALEAKIIVKLVDSNVLGESDYERFFARLGQGGTRLSDDELSYSLIKDKYPKVHDRVEEIVKGPGRFASEVDLVLGALRIAQTLAPWPNSKEWEQVRRPTPDRVRQVHEKGQDTTEPYFCSMLPDGDSAPVRLKTAVEHLRDGLLYDATSNNCGLPSMLLAHLPRGLLDVLLLFTFKRGETNRWGEVDRKPLIAFVLHWLIFVANDDKAADYTFKEAQPNEWCFGELRVAALIRHFEREGIARHAPRCRDWDPLKKEVKQRKCGLATWAERFSVCDTKPPSPGEALRILSTHRELTKRALIWLQRNYITRTFPHYDPTSTRDDDLPFDLDHAIPHHRFGTDWPTVKKQICLPDHIQSTFKDRRHTVGDSLGNRRWLSAADNRGRGMGPIEEKRRKEDKLPSLDDHLVRQPWNELIETKPWTDKDVATFQRLIDSRTLLLTRRLMVKSGIAHLIDIVDQTPRGSPS